MSSTTTNTSTANGNTHGAAAPATEPQLRNVVPRRAASTNGSGTAAAAVETAWQLRSHVVGRVSGGDLVWLALAFPAALAGPCVAQLRAAHRSACEPPEAADAAACDALVGAVARGRLGDARALLGGPLGPSLLRWRSAGRAAELVCFLLHRSWKLYTGDPPVIDMSKELKWARNSDKCSVRIGVGIRGHEGLYCGCALPINYAECSVQSGIQCISCREMLTGLLQSAFGACPHCPGTASLVVTSDPYPSAPTTHWRCSVCHTEFEKQTGRKALANTLLIRCGTCDFKLCRTCAMAVAGLTPRDPQQTFVCDPPSSAGPQPEQGEQKTLTCTDSFTRRLEGLDGLVNSRGRPVFFGPNNNIGGVYCGAVLDDQALRTYTNGFLCGLEAGNECSACHELHRQILDDRVVRHSTHRLRSGWKCAMCDDHFKYKLARPGVLVTRCSCGHYDLCSRCYLGVIGAGFSDSERISETASTVYWDQLLGFDDWTTTLQQPLPARLFFLACAMGMAQSLRIMLQKPLCLDRASAVDGHDSQFYKDALLFALMRRDGWIDQEQPDDIGRGGFVDVVRAMLQPPLTPAELSRSRVRTLLLWSLKFAEEDVHEIVSLLMAPPVSLTAEQCFKDQFFVEKVAENERSVEMLSRSQLGIEQGRWECWLTENSVELKRSSCLVVDGWAFGEEDEDVDRPDYDTRLIGGEHVPRLFEH
eukprot:m51a1_g14406 hypothetical protein (703) ;mRNA; f:388447-390953